MSPTPAAATATTNAAIPNQFALSAGGGGFDLDTGGASVRGGKGVVGVSWNANGLVSACGSKELRTCTFAH
jgi:hypothetical protein